MTNNNKDMSTTKHPSEPWIKKTAAQYANRIIRSIESKDGVHGTVVAQREVYAEGDEYDQGLDRIVACVNACKGIADPSAVPELLEALGLVAELLALDEKEGLDCYALRARHDVAAAIAKATGTNI